MSHAQACRWPSHNLRPRRTGADNAVTQADDAFGFSVGRESIGIYSRGNTRGFSPSQAGNIRLEELYFDDLYDSRSA